MRKDELTPRQQGQRAAFVIRLQEAGWEESAFNRLFDQGKMTPIEAQLLCHNPHLLLSVSYLAGAGQLSLEVRDPESHAGLALVTVFGDRMAEWLTVVLVHQKRLAPENYREVFEALSTAFPESVLELVVSGGQVHLPLSDPLAERLLAAPWEDHALQHYTTYLTPEELARLQDEVVQG